VAEEAAVERPETLVTVVACTAPTESWYPTELMLDEEIMMELPGVSKLVTKPEKGVREASDTEVTKL
jgi:hypothetical protein